MRVVEKQKRVREYRGQIASPGRPTIAWRQDRVRFWIAIAGGAKTVDAGDRCRSVRAGRSSLIQACWWGESATVPPECFCSVHLVVRA